MPRITDYSFLFQSMFGTSRMNLVNNIQLSQINSSSVQAQLKAAGIDTNSKQYKAALSEMMKNGNGAMFTNVQAIKNLMSQYDKNGDWVDPNTGLTGLAVTDENRNSYKHIISILESSREEMFELAKKEFLRDNGTLNGDTTKRESEIAEDAEKESETIGGSVGVNVGKTARKIAAAKTTSQLRAVIAEIKGDMQEVKAGIEKGWCDESEMEKVNSLMAQAQNRMGQVEDREATPEEENMFAMASLM